MMAMAPTKRDYTEAKWIPWYVEDSPGWLELSLSARGAAEGIARKMNAKGELHLGSRGLRGLAVLLRRPWEEVGPAVDELLTRGPNGEAPRLVYDPTTGVLFDPEAVNRRRRPAVPSNERVKRHREKAKGTASGETDVTPVTPVTPPSISRSSLISDLDLSDPDRAHAEVEPAPDSGVRLPAASEPELEPVERGFDTGTASCDAARRRFTEAVAEATGKRFALTRAPFHDRDLCDVLNAHAPPGVPKQEALAWLAGVVAEWVRALDGRNPNGWQPGRLMDWLNGGKAAPGSGGRALRGAEITKQAYDPSAPWHRDDWQPERVEVNPLAPPEMQARLLAAVGGRR